MMPYLLPVLWCGCDITPGVLCTAYCKPPPDRADTAPAGLEQAAEPEGLQHDHEMEDELAANLKDDPLSAYDVDVSMEGAAIEQYLQLMNDQEKGKRAS